MKRPRFTKAELEAIEFALSHVLSGAYEEEFGEDSEVPKRERLESAQEKVAVMKRNRQKGA